MLKFVLIRSKPSSPVFSTTTASCDVFTPMASAISDGRTGERKLASQSLTLSIWTTETILDRSTISGIRRPAGFLLRGGLSTW